MSLHLIDNISAVLFDMDGTLVDSELLTEPAIRQVCAEYGIRKFDLDCIQFFGAAWLDIENGLKEHFSALVGSTGIANRLHEVYHELLDAEAPPVIPLARETVVAANARLPTTIVSSSGRSAIETTIGRLQIEEQIPFFTGAEDVERAKPAPDPYLRAATELNVHPAECLVFEDSIPGITSARRAGMQVVAIAHRCNDVNTASKLADAIIQDYRDLDSGFFENVSKIRK